VRRVGWSQAEESSEDALPAAPPAWNEDVLRLQEFLMGFPECADFGSAALAQRMADAADLPAAVARALLTEGVDAAYAKVQNKEIFTPPVVEVTHPAPLSRHLESRAKAEKQAWFLKCQGG
jgi:hypothetical protein